MYFLFSKILWLIIAPSSFLVICLCLAFLLALFGRLRVASFIGGGATVLLAVLSFSPMSERLALSLEHRFPAYREDGRPIKGVIVLGGGLNLAASMTQGRLVLGAAGDRLVAMADLARRYPEAKIVFTGGSGYLAGSSGSEADVIEQYLTTLGVDPNRILFERASRNTYENALMTKALVQPAPDEHWLLVTSALHMPRAMGLFRAAGFDLEAYPVDWRTAPAFGGMLGDDPASSRLRLFDLATREWIGLFASRLTGQSRELFPAP